MQNAVFRFFSSNVSFHQSSEIFYHESNHPPRVGRVSFRDDQFTSDFLLQFSFHVDQSNLIGKKKDLLSK